MHAYNSIFLDQYLVVRIVRLLLKQTSRDQVRLHHYFNLPVRFEGNVGHFIICMLFTGPDIMTFDTLYGNTRRHALEKGLHIRKIQCLCFMGA